MKKKGCEGFISFKHRLKDRENQSINFSALERIDRGVRTAILKSEEEVARTINMIEIGNIEDTIQKVEASRRTIIFAGGLSELIAQEMMVEFQLADKYYELHANPEIIKNINKKLSKEDAALFASLNGETQELVVAGKNCCDSGIGIVLSTVSKYSSLVKYIGIPFVGFKSGGSFSPDYKVRSRLPLPILARILLDAYTLRTATQAFLNSRKQALLYSK